jgi:uncharacterized protein (AIM24 family)
MSPAAERFLTETLEPARPTDTFDIVGQRLVRVDVHDEVWIKRGSVVAYHGDLKFHLEPVMQAEAVHLDAGPIRSALKREAVPLTRAVGQGRLYLSNDGTHSRVLSLGDETIFVSASDLLAFETTLDHEIRLLGEIGLLAGGLLVVKLSGHGQVAISVHGEPLTLRVSPSDPVSTDPGATLAWTAGLWPELKTDLDAGSLIAHGGGQPIQMRFAGHGHVIVHARSRAEAMRTGVLNALEARIKSLFV